MNYIRVFYPNQFNQVLLSVLLDGKRQRTNWHKLEECADLAQDGFRFDARLLLVDILSRLDLKTSLRKNETRVNLHLNNIILTGWFVNRRYIARQNLLEVNNRVWKTFQMVFHPMILSQTGNRSQSQGSYYHNGTRLVTDVVTNIYLLSPT